MKGPETFHSMDFVRLFLTAVIRETGKAWEPSDYRMGVLRTRMRNAISVGADPYELAVSLDRLAVCWNHYADDGELYSYFDLPYLLQWTRARSRVKDFWRHLFYSRFARTDEEVQYYRRWLASWDAAEEEGYDNPQWSPLRDESRERLETAENRVRAENRQPAWRWNGPRTILADTFLEVGDDARGT